MRSSNSASISASLSGKRRYTVPTPTPAWAAIWSSDASSPRSANTSRAACRIRRRLRSASRRSWRSLALGVVPAISSFILTQIRRSWLRFVLRLPSEVEMQPPFRTEVPMSKPSGSQFERRWWILAVIGVAQLMVVLDTTIVNVALPSAQRALHFSNDNRQWIVTAYALAFGSLLLLGGRIGDLFGRKWTLIGGLAGFSIASAVGGAARSLP